LLFGEAVADGEVLDATVVVSGLPVAASHTIAVQSQLPVTMRLPSRL